MPIDMFETREMLPLLEVIPPAQTFLKRTFFGNAHSSEAEFVDIDIVAGKRRLAPIVAPRIGSKTVEREGYKTQSYKPPQVAPDMITTAENMLKRAPGENIYGAQSPDERAAQQLVKDMAEMDDMITRREEQMCSQALFTGQIHLVGEGVDDTMQYWSQLPAQEQPFEVLAANAKWDASGVDILTQLRSRRRQVVQRSGIAPNIALLGSEAADAMLANKELAALLDTQRIDLGEISPEFFEDGVTYLGRMKGSGLEFWSYDEWYLDSSGIEQPMVPVNQVLLGSPRVRTSMLYGCVVDPVQGSFALPRVPVSYTMRKPVEGRVLAVKSRPLPAIHQIYGFHVMEVL